MDARVSLRLGEELPGEAAAGEEVEVDRGPVGREVIGERVELHLLAVGELSGCPLGERSIVRLSAGLFLTFSVRRDGR
jgi:hypothetical protein